MSNMSCIGFPVETEDEFGDLAVSKANKALEYKTHQGAYLCWEEDEDFGPELWVQAEGDAIVGMHPYFRGKSEMRVGALNLVENEFQTTLDASIYGWIDPETKDPESGVCPCLFDMVNYKIYNDISFPFIEKFSVAAFAQEIDVYESEAAYEEENPPMTEEDLDNITDETPMAMAAESLMPVGLFNEEEGEPPEAYAMLTGKVLETKKMINPDTKKEYHWALVKTLGGTVDVIAAPDMIDQEIVKDGIVSGIFWFCADIKFDEEKA